MSIWEITPHFKAKSHLDRNLIIRNTYSAGNVRNLIENLRTEPDTSLFIKTMENQQSYSSIFTLKR